MSTAPKALVAKVRETADKYSPPADKLEAIRNQLRIARDMEVEISDLTQKLKDKQAEFTKIQMEVLPQLFAELNIDKLGLEAEGNLPAYDAEAKPYYKASISAEWPIEKQNEAYGWLRQHKFGDMIKNVVSAQFGKGQDKTAKKLAAFMKKEKIEFEQKSTVPWNSLTAFVKEQVEKGETLPLEVLGATVGRIVRLKPRKEKN